MKKLFLILAIVLIPVFASANPWLICDPQAGVTSYKLTGPSWVPATTPAQADGSLKLDVGNALPGANNLTVAACKTDAVWGELCSASVPFVLTRPSAPAITSNIKLIP